MIHIILRKGQISDFFCTRIIRIERISTDFLVVFQCVRKGFFSASQKIGLNANHYFTPCLL
jgi:hypothetical protein